MLHQKLFKDGRTNDCFPYYNEAHPKCQDDCGRIGIENEWGRWVGWVAGDGHEL